MRKRGGGSGGRKKLTATTVNILESMCVDKGRFREEQVKRARTFNYECGKIETMLRGMMEEFESWQEIEWDEDDEWGSMSHARLAEWKRTLERFDVPEECTDSARVLFDAIDALSNDILKANGTLPWVRAVYDERASIGEIPLLPETMPITPHQELRNEQEIVQDQIDEQSGARERVVRKRTPGRGTGTDDTKINHMTSQGWLRTKLKLVIKATKVIREIGVKYIDRTKAKCLPTCAFFARWYDGSHRIDESPVWARDAGALVAIHRHYADMSVLPQHERLTTLFRGMLSIHEGEKSRNGCVRPPRDDMATPVRRSLTNPV